MTSPLSFPEKITRGDAVASARGRVEKEGPKRRVLVSIRTEHLFSTRPRTLVNASPLAIFWGNDSREAPCYFSVRGHGRSCPLRPSKWHGMLPTLSTRSHTSSTLPRLHAQELGAPPFTHRGGGTGGGCVPKGEPNPCTSAPAPGGPR